MISIFPGSVLADNADPVASGRTEGIMNHGPPEDRPMDVTLPIFIRSHPAQTSVTGVLGSVPWQLVSSLQQVVLEDKQNPSRAEGMRRAVLTEHRDDRSWSLQCS